MAVCMYFWNKNCAHKSGTLMSKNTTILATITSGWDATETRNVCYRMNAWTCRFFTSCVSNLHNKNKNSTFKCLSWRQRRPDKNSKNGFVILGPLLAPILLGCFSINTSFFIDFLQFTQHSTNNKKWIRVKSPQFFTFHSWIITHFSGFVLPLWVPFTADHQS